MTPFSNFYNITPTEISAAVILFNLSLSFILLLVILYVYKRTRHGLSYSQSFVFTLVIVGVLCTAIMMAVQNNVIGAIAIFGAFTLIRFRSILKETSDLAYIFFALVVGIAVGLGHYPLALITTSFLSIIIYTFYKLGFGSVSDNFDYLLIFSTEGKFSVDSVYPIIEKYVDSRELLNTKTIGETSEYSFSLDIKKKTDPTLLSNEIAKASGITSVEILTGKNTSEF